MIRYSLTGFSQCLLVDYLSYRSAIVSYTEIKLTFLMLIENRSNGDDRFFQLTHRFLYRAINVRRKHAVKIKGAVA